MSVGRGDVAPVSRPGQYQSLLPLHGPRMELVVRLKGGDPFVLDAAGKRQKRWLLRGSNSKLCRCDGSGCGSCLCGYSGDPPDVSLYGHVCSRGMRILPACGLVGMAQISQCIRDARVHDGHENLPSIVDRITVVEGRSPDTPVAAIRWGTRAGQRTIVGHLCDIVERTEAAHLEPPTGDRCG